MMNDVYNRELVNEKRKDNFTVTITKLTHKYLFQVSYLVSISNGNPVPKYARSYKSLAAAKRKYNEI